MPESSYALNGVSISQEVVAIVQLTVKNVDIVIFICYSEIKRLPSFDRLAKLNTIT